MKEHLMSEKNQSENEYLSYRIFKETVGEETRFSIKRVVLDEDRNIISISKNPVDFAEETLDKLQQFSLLVIEEAFTQSVIDMTRWHELRTTDK
jgi:hypothetical protein